MLVFIESNCLQTLTLQETDILLQTQWKKDSNLDQESLQIGIFIVAEILSAQMYTSFFKCLCIINILSCMYLCHSSSLKVALNFYHLTVG